MSEITFCVGDLVRCTTEHIWRFDDFEYQLNDVQNLYLAVSYTGVCRPAKYTGEKRFVILLGSDGVLYVSILKFVELVKK